MDRPILFSAPMVRAILAGKKTQTRRLVREQRLMLDSGGTPFTQCWDNEEQINWRRDVRCPHGVAGDRLWVKERWFPRVVHTHAMDACDCGDVEIAYCADGATRFFSDDFFCDNELSNWTIPQSARAGKDASPLFMPRWASRLTLEITDVRVERLQDISEADALAEGIAHTKTSLVGVASGYGASMRTTAAQAFEELWDSLNAKRAPWSSNPWVWVLSFKAVK